VGLAVEGFAVGVPAVELVRADGLRVAGLAVGLRVVGLEVGLRVVGRAVGRRVVGLAVGRRVVGLAVGRRVLDGLRVVGLEAFVGLFVGFTVEFCAGLRRNAVSLSMSMKTPAPKPICTMHIHSKDRQAGQRKRYRTTQA
jgi:hypothetical protein